MLHMSFNPDQLVREARAASPALDTAYNRSEQEQQLYLSPVVAYFGRLEAEIADMPIASRFRTDKTPDHFVAVGNRGMVHPLYADLSEADYKRAQLLSDLRTLRTNALNLIGGVHSLVMDMEATKTEG